jgi:hypothetical protein
MGFLVLVAAPVFVIVVYVVAGLRWEIVLAAAAVAPGGRHYAVTEPRRRRAVTRRPTGDTRTDDTATWPPCLLAQGRILGRGQQLRQVRF